MNAGWRYAAVVLGCLSGAGAALSEQAQPARLDCTARDCPALVIRGDDVSRYPNGQPAAFRGFADPCLRRDPVSGRLWLVYSWPHMESLGPSGRGPDRRRYAVGVETHLASSDDAGRTWHKRAVLWPRTPARYAAPGGSAPVDGFESHEVPNISPITRDGRRAWAGVRLDYFLGREGNYRARDPRSFCLRLMAAASPGELARAEPFTLGLAINAGEAHVDLDLGTLSTEFPARFIPNEPALFFEGGRLYLAFVVMTFSGQTPDFPRSFVALLSAEPRGDVRAWRWRYEGKLAAHAEARELGGDALTQVELARSREGRLLAFLTPEAWDAELALEFGSDPFGGIVHRGVAVVEVASLTPPALARREGGGLALRALLTASGAGERGPGAAGYDAASATGVLFTLREIALGRSLSWSLHETRLHP